MLLAELNIWHTRRHMPTRRVALGERLLPTGHPGYGPILLAAIAAANVDGLDEEQAEAFPAFLRSARGGLSIPRRALRFRLQTDVEGLAVSRHRLFGTHGNPAVELDVHGRHPVPQVLGAVMAASRLAPYPRAVTLRAMERAVQRPGVMPEGVEVRYVTEAPLRPPPAGVGNRRAVDGVLELPAEYRWAMEVLGFWPGMTPGRDEVLRRFRRLVRLAHPDHGGAHRGAAERIVELGEARRVLLGDGDRGGQAAGGV